MLNRLYVHNYRCLNNFELRLKDKPSVLLLGRNGSGKSSVRSALEILQHIARGTNRVGTLIKRADLYRDRTDEPVRVEVEAEINARLYRYALALEYPQGFRELRVLSESLECDGLGIFSRDRAQVHLGPASDNPNGFRIDWHVVALPLIQERSAEDPLAIFRLWLARSLILDPIPSRITGESSEETLEPDREVRRLGGWFAGLIAHAPATYADIDSYLRGILPDLLDIKNPVVAESAEHRSRRLTVNFRAETHEHVLSVPFAALSDGEKSAFVCALVLAASKAHNPIFCFWDEPDSHLALDEVGHFITELRRAFKNNGGQLVVTSHSEETIRRFSHENTFLLHRKSHLEPTQVSALSDLDIAGDLVGALIRGDVAP